MLLSVLSLLALSSFVVSTYTPTGSPAKSSGAMSPRHHYGSRSGRSNTTISSESRKEVAGEVKSTRLDLSYHLPPPLLYITGIASSDEALVEEKAEKEETETAAQSPQQEEKKRAGDELFREKPAKRVRLDLSQQSPSSGPGTASILRAGPTKPTSTNSSSMSVQLNSSFMRKASVNLALFTGDRPVKLENRVVLYNLVETATPALMNAFAKRFCLDQSDEECVQYVLMFKEPARSIFPNFAVIQFKDQYSKYSLLNNYQGDEMCPCLSDSLLARSCDDTVPRFLYRVKAFQYPKLHPNLNAKFQECTRQSFWGQREVLISVSGGNQIVGAKRVWYKEAHFFFKTDAEMQEAAQLLNGQGLKKVKIG